MFSSTADCWKSRKWARWMFQELKSAIDARSCHEYRDFGGRDARGDTARGRRELAELESWW